MNDLTVLKTALRNTGLTGTAHIHREVAETGCCQITQESLE